MPNVVDRYNNQSKIPYHCSLSRVPTKLLTGLKLFNEGWLEQKGNVFPAAKSVHQKLLGIIQYQFSFFPDFSTEPLVMEARVVLGRIHFYFHSGCVAGG